MLLPILCYHHVGVPATGNGHRHLWLSRERFATQMAYLAEQGYSCLNLRDALASLNGGHEIPLRSAVVTFDDGYEDFRREAYPVLRSYGFRATVFLVAGAVGGVSRWAGNPEFPLMGWKDIRELSPEGIEFGSHSLTHPRLTRVPLDAAERELRESRQILEDELGTAVHSFSYPYGAWDLNVEKLVREADYQFACSMLQGNLHAPRARYHLKRVAVDELTPMAQFRRMLSPVYDVTARLQRWSRPARRLSRWLRRVTFS
ncbi:MAG: polysaccharide deacetylase family protein [Candidatus Binatia bacterium]